MKKLIRNNKTKNEILSFLNKTNALSSESIWKISEILKRDIDLVFMVSDDLEKLEYLTSIPTTTAQGDGKIITITRKGKLFIKGGGYPSSGYRIIKHAIITNKTTIISIIALIISILSYLNN